ncbi:covalently-linked cell wall protein [Colletotrichum karsti]|uniref:Covalently-linked cell wall protein n=1 Tax=Colletotrichum karsti TaxID=1095194 RepID=A0A9P6IEU0_9PEZI|nr:covalently-linked cell wall protein [Colletotrichum karsti]KAF9880586.1 covalently-linked cell wall protein [Colletotrichum karsti]
MKFSIATVATFASMVMAMPQAASGAALAPKDSPPDGCQTSYAGNFGITIVSLGKRSLETRSNCGQQGSLDLVLKDSVLTDSKGRIGSIVANYQFQFDGPPQSGVIYTSGFSVCGNGSLALGGSTTFYQCKSGDFSNLYDRSWAPQCSPIHLNVLPCAADAPTPSGNVVGTTMVATAYVSVIGDGQPQVIPTTVPVPICQIGDGQIQGHTTPCGELPPVTKTPPPPAPSAPASEPAYTPPGTPVPPPVTTPVAPPVESTPQPSAPPVNTSVPVVPPASTPVASNPATTPAAPSSTSPAAPPAAAGDHIVPAPLVALVAGLLAVLYMV